MTANSLLKNLLHVKGATVDTFDFGENALGEPSLVVHVHVHKKERSKYALGKNEQNLTDRQRERLSMIQAEDGPMARGHRLKERLRAVFALKDPDLAEEHLDKWFRSAQHCRIAAFVELQRKIRRHREHILNTIRFGLSNARIEATNNKIKLLLRIAYGFRNVDTMISLVMLFCSSIEIPWPGRKREGLAKTVVK